MTREYETVAGIVGRIVRDIQRHKPNGKQNKSAEKENRPLLYERGNIEQRGRRPRL